MPEQDNPQLKQFENIISRVNAATKSLNRCDVNEFMEKYAVLFTKQAKEEINQDTIAEISEAFTTRFDLFSSIKLIDKTGNIVVELPAVFNSIENVSVNREHVANQLSQLSMLKLLPSQQDDIYNSVTSGLIASQLKEGETNKEYVESRRNAFDEYIEKFNLIRDGKTNTMNETQVTENTQVDFSDDLF
jgi:hypothetical protein